MSDELAVSKTSDHRGWSEPSVVIDRRDDVDESRGLVSWSGCSPDALINHSAVAAPPRNVIDQDQHCMAAVMLLPSIIGEHTAALFR